MREQRTGAQMIEAERLRQIEAEGWTADHDSEHELGELAQAAACYIDAARTQIMDTRHFLPIVDRETQMPNLWPWQTEWWKPKDPLRNLVRAGALVAAEIDRLQREETP